MGLGVSAEILSQPIPIVILGVPIGYAKVGGVVDGSAQGTLFWKSNFPAWPNEADVVFLVGAGPKGVVELFGGGLGGEVTGTASVEAEYTVPPASFEFKGYCISLEGKVTAVWGIFEETWKRAGDPPVLRVRFWCL